MSGPNHPDWLAELEEQVAREKTISSHTLRRLLAKVEEYSQTHRAFGLPDDLLAILANEPARPAESETLESASGGSAPDQNRKSKIENRKSKIDSLTLENFGPYYGRHTFDFSTVGGQCGILIGGKTGAGKTHLLRALYLAVVGESGVFDLKKIEPGSEATRFLFEKSLNRRAHAEGQDTTRLQVAISQQDDHGVPRQKAIFVREIRHRPRSIPVWRSWAETADGSPRIEDPQHLENLRDALLPRHLARFFFFDAERGLNFNFGQQEVVEGVSRIIGLWSYAELEADLRHLIQQKIPRIFNAAAAHEAATKLAELSGRVVTAEGQLIALREECSRVSTEINLTKSELTQVEEQINSFPAAHASPLEKTAETRAKAAEAKARLKSELSAAWEISIPIALFGASRRKLHEDLLAEEKRREWESSTAALTTKIPQVQHDFFNDIPAEHRLSDNSSAFYKQRLEQALHRLLPPPPPGMASQVFMTDQTERSARIRMQLARTVNDLGRLADLSAPSNRPASPRSADFSPPHRPQTPTTTTKPNPPHETTSDIPLPTGEGQGEGKQRIRTTGDSRLHRHLASYILLIPPFPNRKSKIKNHSAKPMLPDETSSR